ncbi:MAG: anaerobic dehydrogenase, typically selenocysteine-containing [Actinomycetia bacterium]|nr:anaerobic dehydrogenase, typically selenocysteine-containing [Actinomycetes bacterium]
MTSTMHTRTCPLCEAMCGLDVTVEDERVTLIRPNRRDVWSKGFICPKGTVLGHLHEDPDRLRAPMVRDGDTWREVSWEEAFERCETLLRAVLDEHGKDAVTTYIGNPTAHNFSLSRYVPAFIAISGLSQIYSAGTVDQWPKNVTSLLMYGGMWTFPIPDVGRTQYLVVMGANPHASQGSLLAHPDLVGEIERIRDRGGKTVVVDPRRTGTAERADEWVPIVPGTDAAFLLAIAHVLFEEDLVDLGDVAGIVDGVDLVRDLAAGFSPEDVATLCRVPAATIRRIARELAVTEAGTVYGRIGLCNQEFGTLASWLVDVVNVLTGNFDRPGGTMFAKSIAWSLTSLPNPEHENGVEFGRWRSRVRGAPEVLGQVPVSCLAEEIATPGDGQLRALVTVAGNPVISAPDSQHLDAALPLLDCMISIDNYLNETTRHAHVILPGLSALEQPHYDEMIWSWATRSAGKYSPALFPRTDRPHEWEILLRLAAMIAGMPASPDDARAIDDGFFAALVAMKCAEEGSPIAGQNPDDIVAEYSTGGPERFLDFAIRIGPWGDAYRANPDGLTLRSFEAAPDGIDMGPLVPRVREVVTTPNGHINLAPAHVTGDIPRLRERLERATDDGLVLVSRRHVRSNNSWMHNVRVLVKGKDRCTLLVHPDDAERIGLRNGGHAKVVSEAGSLVAPVEVSDEMMRGVVSLPHGWGHDRPGVRLSVAAEHAGVNNNHLAPGDFVDVPSGNAAVNGIPVEVAPA